MEAVKLKLGLGMDTVVSLSSSSSPTSVKLMLGTSRSAPNPRLLLKRSSSNARARLRSASSSSSATATTPPSTMAEKRKEKDLVFVAGATGRVGSRAVKELIRLGFRVRAAVRNPQRTATLLQSVQQLNLDDDGAAAEEKLEIVECDLEKQPQEGIVCAMGNASIVVCSIGASEKEIFDVTGPYRIDYMATDKLVQAASAAKVEHFILVTSLGTNKIGFPAFLLNLFWGVLCWKRRAEEALIASGIPYTIIRPGGMERPTDAYKETHNLVVAAEDTYVGGQVSNLQVAELIAAMAKNRKAAYCKVVEAIAETTAPLLPIDQLLSAIPSNREPLADEEEEQEVKEDTTVESESHPPVAAASRPLSPYTAYEGLKPPSSPSPTSAASSSNKQLQQVAAVEEEASSAAATSSSSRPLSPYTAFMDLKPPSSPSPSSAKATGSSSTGASLLDSSANGTPTSSNTASQLQAGEKKKQQQQQPLSPYTRYEDLKPPSSPTPLAPKV